MSVKSQTSSNVIVATFQPGAVDAAIVANGAEKAHTTKTEAAPAKPLTKKELTAKARKQAQENERLATIGDLVQRIGDEIGHFTADKELAQDQLQVLVGNLLTDAMNAGLTVEMLKAPTKASPQECYVALVDAINAPRVAIGLPELKNSVRDNYLSRIRSFLKSRGAEPLDLFGNIAKAKAKAAAKSDASEADEGDEAERVTARTVSFNAKQGTDESLIGLPALQKFLNAWIDANGEGKVKASFVQMAVDLRDEVAEILSTK